ncbi:MAG: ORF6N domain-containing protein [Bacteroidota bacterium]|nr:ORF6N domain-containing protein [Bacteroidota bacterium]
MSNPIAIIEENVIDKIYLIRGKKVMLDRDLSNMYGVETRVLNQAVKRNETRFPKDFMFQLTKDELKNWMSQFVISNKEKMGFRKMPYVFTEQGVAMLSSVLKSETAIEVNIQIIRIFTRIRELIVNEKDVLLKLEKLEIEMIKNDEGLRKQGEEIQTIFRAIKQLIRPNQEPRKKIGYKKGD